MVVFTERELAVMARALERATVVEIARHLELDANIVATHLENIGEKFRLAGRMYRATQ